VIPLLSKKGAQPSPIGRGWPRSGRVRGRGADRLRTAARPRSIPLTPDLWSDPLPLGEGVRDSLEMSNVGEIHPASKKGAQASPLGRGWPRRGRERGYGFDRLRAPARPRSFPLTPVLRTDPLPLGEGNANLFSVEAGKGRSRRARARNIGSAQNLLQHPVQSFFHVVVGEAQLQITMTFDQSAALGVGQRLVRVMFPVELDCQAEAVTAEVGDMAGDRDLTAKLESVESRSAQFAPENVFSAGAVAPKSSSDENVFARHSSIKSQNSMAGNPSSGRSAATLSHWERVRFAR